MIELVDHPPFIGEKGYLELSELILRHGGDKGTKRTGEDVLSIPNQQLHFDLTAGFPMITTKLVPWAAVAGELLWFLEGGYRTGARMSDGRLLDISNSFRKKPIGDTIWTDNALADSWLPKAQFPGDLGTIYGSQWRTWKSPYGDEIDQLQNLINRAKNDRNDRRLLASAWNPADFFKMALPPCHVLFQINIIEGQLALHMYQRSADIFLGVPFNIPSYALLAHMLGNVLDAQPSLLTISFGDSHIYKNHIEQMETQLTREILPMPQLLLDPRINDIDSFDHNSIVLQGYKSHKKLGGVMAVDRKKPVEQLQTIEQ